MAMKVKITYTNYRGETAEREIIPRSRWWGFTTYHPEKQWLIGALDVDKCALRDFAERDISQGLEQVHEALGVTNDV
jgi:hypothetical protein